MNRRRPHPKKLVWEIALLAASTCLLSLSCLIIAGSYFLAPQAATLPVERWLYLNLPYLGDIKLAGAVLILLLWLAGSMLLIGRALNERRIPWAGLGLAALTPTLLLSFCSLFAYAAVWWAPFPLGR
jgi:hypothetical protein